MTHSHLLPIEEQKEALRHDVIDAPNRYRIVFVGNFFQGPTGIVASLHRALETVGHTVFKIDTAMHKEVLDKSSGAKGGYGPVWLKPQAIERVLDTFQPEVIVSCAGGIVLNPEDSEYLRARNIVSVGLTLSDPDVQDSVIDHVGNFDVHTTNAQLAYDRYLAEGHTNTFLFPFGIDRSYILRDVAEDKNLRADAIAIGHAQGRPDRHEIMVPLADRVKVKTYGTGWPIPGSESVSGDQLLQAAKGGTVHVNFPATRAGFTNVKCGVFETIGAGGVLATTEFEEMSRLFEYGTEIIGYSTAEDLGDRILELINDPDRLESLRRRSFARLLAEHLYERRWNTLFTQLLTALDEGAGPWESDRRQQLRSRLSISHERPRNVLISGYYGARNRGDDILLKALRDRIVAEVPDANVIAAAVNAKEVERSQGVQAFRRADPFESDKHASSATSVILGPGGLWHDYTIQAAGGVAGIVTGTTISPAHLVQLPLMVRAHGGSFHVHGLGVGPLKDSSAKSAVNLTGMLAESLTVRDQESLELLSGMDGAWPNTPRVSPDVAYTLPLTGIDDAETELLPDKPYLAVNVRPFQDNDESLETIRDVVFTFAKQHDLAILGVPMQPVDENEMRKWETFDNDGRLWILPQDAPYSVFLRSLRDATAIVSMRLHTNLFAHRVGRAPVGIAYDPKLAGHFSQLDRADFAVEMPVDRERLWNALLTAYSSSDLDDPTKIKVRELEERANSTLSDLCRSIAATDKRLPDTGSMVQAPLKEQKTNTLAPWPVAQSVDLRGAIVRAGSEISAAREVDVIRRTTVKGDLFYMDVRAPLRGDYATWRLDVPVPSDEDGVRIELWLHQRYKEKRNLAGRLAYEVSLDGETLFREDIAGWSERNSVWIAKRTMADSVQLRVRVVALRKTENWGWGKAAAMTIEAVRVLPWASTTDLEWGASSPASVPVTTKREEPIGPEALPITVEQDSVDRANSQLATSAPGAPLVGEGSETTTDVERLVEHEFSEMSEGKTEQLGSGKEPLDPGAKSEPVTEPAKVEPDPVATSEVQDQLTQHGDASELPLQPESGPVEHQAPEQTEPSTAGIDERVQATPEVRHRPWWKVW